MLTSDTIWQQICHAARDDLSPSESGVVLDNGGWTVRGTLGPEAENIAALFVPLLGPLPESRPLVVGHLAQSLDGCIAREDGESHWISGQEDLDHTHRLRALCDAVLVGAGTVIKDDCRLTVRRCEGQNPLRVVLDPNASVPTESALFSDATAPTLWITGSTGADPGQPLGENVDILKLPCEGGRFALDRVLSALADRGVRRLFVEGGGFTITRFLKAGLMDRLHIAMAPIFMGSGRSSTQEALGQSLADCPRPQVSVYPMGGDWLFDCEFRQG